MVELKIDGCSSSCKKIRKKYWWNSFWPNFSHILSACNFESYSVLTLYMAKKKKLFYLSRFLKSENANRFLSSRQIMGAYWPSGLRCQNGNPMLCGIPGWEGDQINLAPYICTVVYFVGVPPTGLLLLTALKRITPGCHYVWFRGDTVSRSSPPGAWGRQANQGPYTRLPLGV